MTLGRFGVLTFVLLLGCGPAVGVETDGSESTGGGSSSGTTATPMTSGPLPGGESVGVTTSPGPITDPSTATVGSATSPGTDGSTESSGGATSGSFLLDPDGGIGGTPCSTFDQDCPPGDACRAWANDGGPLWNFLRCSPVAPEPDEAGEPCMVEGSAVSGVDSCDVGAMCVNVDDETLEGTCAQFCVGSPESPSCTDPTTACVEGNDGWIALCMISCDPLLQDCGGGHACVGSWGDPQFFCATQGLPYEDDVQVQVAACGVGQVAVPADLHAECDGSEPCCVDFCDLTFGNAECDDGLECVAWAKEGSVLGEFNVGACLSP